MPQNWVFQKRLMNSFEKSNSPTVLITSEEDLHRYEQCTSLLRISSLQKLARTDPMECKIYSGMQNSMLTSSVLIKHQLAKLLNMTMQVLIEAMLKKCVPSMSEYAAIARRGSQ